GEERQQVDAARGIAHFVVVPRRHVQERAVDHVRRERVHHARVEAADVIDRDERLVAHIEDAFEARAGRLLEGAVHFFDGGLLLDFRRQLHYGYVGGGHAQRDAVDLPLHFRNHEARGLGGAGGGRDDTQPGGAGAAQVLVRQVEDLLIVRIAVDRRHEA